jgi:hypothetical protein
MFPTSSLERRGDRLLLRRQSATPAERLAVATAILDALAPARHKHAA